MSGYEHIRRRWVAAFSASGLFNGEILRTAARRRWVANDTVESSLTGLFPPSTRWSAARMPNPVRDTRSLQSPAVVLQPSVARRFFASEEIFRDFLVREQRRAERFSQPCVVVLAALDGSAGTKTAPEWAVITRAIFAATRETDVVGWVTAGRVIGVVLTDLAASEEETAKDIERRIRAEFAGRLDRGLLARLSLRVHFRAPSKDGASQFWPPDPLLMPGRRTIDGKVRDVLKRTMDIVGSLALLIILSPVFAVIALLIKLKPPGPVFFRQVRVGQNARPFTMLKFRSMYVNADARVHQEYVTQFIKSGGQNGSQNRENGAENELFKLTNDPRITPLGHILRKTSLDELPQLWNVLCGDMSLVGPRPPLFYETEQYAPWHWRRVLDVKPGVTGLWQVAGRSRTTFDGMVRLDLRYVRSRSLWTDIKILLATPAAVITGKGAC